MIAYSTIKEIITNLFASKLVSKVYHDVFIRQEGAQRMPVYRSGNEFGYIGIDDSKSLYCYVRQIGDATNAKTELVGSSQKLFNIKAPFRFVFFNAYESRSFDDLNQAILNISFANNVDLIRFITDSDQLQNLEGTIRGFQLSAKSYYVGLDLSILLKLTEDNCGIEISCNGLSNPICNI